MERIKPWLARLALALGALLVAFTLFRAIRTGATDAPRPKDYRDTHRQAAAMNGGPDHEAPLAPVGFVAGQGMVEPADREIKLGAAVPGLIGRILVKEGDKVKAGTPLLELQDDVEKAEVEAAKADLEGARVQLERAREGHRPEDRMASAADARAARARAALSELALHRQTTLQERGATTADELDRARAQAEIDAATEKAQEARAQAAARGWNRDVDVALAQLQQARARLSEAERRLARLTVKAPSDGTILQLIVREGEYYNPNSPSGSTALLTMGDLSHIRVRIDVDEREAARVSLGQRGYVSAEAFGSRRFPGRVVEIARRMGRKNLRTDEPTERIDTKIREVVLELDDGRELVQGIRAIGTLEDATARR